MSDYAVSAGSSSSAQVWVGAKPPEPQRLANATESIRCEVTPEGELRLIPLDALGAYFLLHFGHGEVRVSWRYLDAFKEQYVDAPYFWTGPQASLKDVLVRSVPRPLLSRGGDPFWTGRSLKPEDHEALTKLLERRVAARSREWAKQRDAERKASAPKATSTNSPKSSPKKRRGA